VTSPVWSRPCVRGKFLYVGEEKLYVRGVTYGTFRPGRDGEFPCRRIVARDFASMAANGINTVRVYTVPPRWLLDLALDHGLRVMVGLPWEQHVAFLDDAGTPAAIEERVRVGVRACAGHPAVLSYVIGNEIPAAVVRWHGHRRVERFLERLYRAAKAEDPDGLVAYVNFPSTEYLRLPFLDFVAFNVYLEQQERLEAYLARLQVLSGTKPLVMAEIGLDSRRNGEDEQARTLDWQVRTAFAAGCAGAFVFAWTDEWHRGGHDIDGWDFGLTDRHRRPKPALAAVRDAFSEAPFAPGIQWPRISVILCSHDGARTIRECCENLARVEYPDYEVIVVDDGSTDGTAAIAREYPFRVISTPNEGLSSARNTGLGAATGEIVAYLDDDAYPDPQWLTYLAATFLSTGHVGVGGPNIAPPHDGLVAWCVDNAPGNPTHVLLSDREAEHIPGCNMAFRKAALEALGGFDPTFRVAGDDVDVCWAVLDRGGTLGFSPAAVIWHHRRGSVRAYWKQQRGYGKSESLLEQKWPGKYDATGNAAWVGRIYAPFRIPLVRLLGGRIYQGTWGTAPFQFTDGPGHSIPWSLFLTPGWYLAILLFALLSTLGIAWAPALVALPLLMCALAGSLAQAGISASQAVRAMPIGSQRAGGWCITAMLHLIQPLARLLGHIRHGLTPWRDRGVAGFVFPHRHTTTIWSGRWQSLDTWLGSIESALRRPRRSVDRGGPYDRWDLEVRGGIAASARLRALVEEHGTGQQFVRLRYWPRYSPAIGALTLSLIVACSGAALSEAWPVCALFAVLSVLLIARALRESTAALATVRSAIERMRPDTHAVCPSLPATSSGADDPRTPIRKSAQRTIRVSSPERGDGMPKEAGYASSLRSTRGANE
jgi:GT2 family glycosyltransferase